MAAAVWVCMCIKFMTVCGGYQRGTLWPRHVSGSLKRRWQNWQKAVYKIDAGPKTHIQEGIHVCVCVCACVYIYDQFAKVLKTVNSALARIAHESMQS